MHAFSTIAPALQMHPSELSELVNRPMEAVAMQQVAMTGTSGVVEVRGEPEPKRILSSVQNSIDSLASMGEWSHREGSPKGSVSLYIEEDTAYQAAVQRKDKKKSKLCACLHKTFGNYILPGVFGISSCRYVERLCPTHPISKELFSNASYYTSKIHNFFAVDILPEIEAIAILLYFPTGQVEAEGLSAISAEIWAATYLLLGVHKNIREADFYDIRSAYTSLVWDASMAYRQTRKYFQALQSFKERILPLWLEIEEIVGITTVTEYAQQQDGGSSLMRLSKVNCVMCKKVPREKSLATVQIQDSLTMENRLNLQVIPETHLGATAGTETLSASGVSFNDLDYGQQMDIIKEILAKPTKALQEGVAAFLRTEPKLLMENIMLITFDGNSDLKDEELVEQGLTCTKAIKILKASLKIMFEEVRMTDAMQFDVTEMIKALSKDVYACLEYSDWVCDKFSEFYSMLKLAYDFALLCFDLDLPSFASVVQRETNSDTKPSKLYLTSSVSGGLNNNTMSSTASFPEPAETKVVSLTDLMTQASRNVFKRQPMIDDDFDWQDFYKTEYHGVLQRLPIRIGNNLLQFSADKEVALVMPESQKGRTFVDAASRAYSSGDVGALERAGHLRNTSQS